MSMKYLGMLVAAMFIAQPAFADDDMGMDNKSCDTIVKSCLDAGYTRDGADGKKFWHDCMKPAIMGKTVTGVTVDSKDAKSCREAKVKQLKKELKELQ